MSRFNAFVAACLLVVCITSPVASNLASVTLQGCTLQTAFSTALRLYDCSVPESSPLSPDPSVTITATPESGCTAPQPTITRSTPVGITVVSIDSIRTSDNWKFTYVFRLVRPVFNRLSSLSLTGVDVQPTVSSSVWTYAATAKNPITSTTITTGCARATDKIAVRGEPFANSKTYNLAVGANVFDIVCSSADGASTTHTLTVTRDDTPWISPFLLGTKTLAPTRPQTDYTVALGLSATTSSIKVIPPKTLLQILLNGAKVNGGSQTTISFPTTSASILVTFDIGDATTGITTFKFTLLRAAAAASGLAQTEVQSALVPK